MARRQSVKIGTRLKQARETVGLTQPVVAGLLGVSLTSVAGWEADTKSPTYDHLLGLCRLYGRDMGWFFLDVDTPARAGEVKNEVVMAALDGYLSILGMNKRQREKAKSTLWWRHTERRRSSNETRHRS